MLGKNSQKNIKLGKINEIEMELFYWLLLNIPHFRR